MQLDTSADLKLHRSICCNILLQYVCCVGRYVMEIALNAADIAHNNRFVFTIEYICARHEHVAGIDNCDHIFTLRARLYQSLLSGNARAAPPCYAKEICTRALVQMCLWWHNHCHVSYMIVTS